MKKILITGANSYIGTSFEKYIKLFSGEYSVDTVDMMDKSWRDKSFSDYDVVFHVAGIAHRKETKENAELYFKINRDLAIEVAEKSKKNGVNYFVFLSSMSVYGMEIGVINKDTKTNPKNNYGKSKLQAEEKITALRSPDFKVAVLRPPMVYGNGCKGNFQTVLKFVKKSPVIPRIKNKRSLIYIDNLSSFVKFCIDQQLDGLFMPQNKEYVCTTEMAKIVAETLGKRVWVSFLVGALVWLCKPFSSFVQKAFGNLIYEDLEQFNFEYCKINTEESIKLSAKNR